MERPRSLVVWRVGLGLPKMDKYYFEKIKFQNFKKRMDLRLEMARGGHEWMINGKG